MAGKEWARRQGKFVEQMMRFPFQFSTGFVLVYVCVCMYTKKGKAIPVTGREDP
jgi:hypothetical protein